MSESITISGNYKVWGFNGHRREYADVTLPFSQAASYLVPQLYNAVTGKGEQRQSADAHVRNITKALVEGEYTPTQFGASITKQHKKTLQLDVDKRTFSLEVTTKTPLHLIDGGHRMAAIKKTLRAHQEKLELAQKDSDKEHYQQVIESIENLPIDFKLYFDGSSQEDFINLQLGKPVDKAHMTSIAIQKGFTNEPALKPAFEIAKLLHKDPTSPFGNLIRFDTGSKLPVPISSLCSKGTSDLSTSLVGLAKIGLAPEDSAKLVTDLFTFFEGNGPELLGQGKVLAPMKNGGKLGSATLFIGVATCVAYSLRVDGLTRAEKDPHLDLALETARNTLDQEIGGDFSSQRKRSLIRGFAQNYFDAASQESHCDLPVGLLKILSPSSYGVEKLPRETK